MWNVAWKNVDAGQPMLFLKAGVLSSSVCMSHYYKQAYLHYQLSTGIKKSLLLLQHMHFLGGNRMKNLSTHNV